MNEQTEKERREHIVFMVNLIADLCEQYGCSPLELAEAVGIRLYGSGVIN